MKYETLTALTAFVFWSVCLVGASIALAGCAPAKYIFNCTVTQPENCN